MNEQYFKHEYMGFYNPSIWWKIKMFFLGEKIEEISWPLKTTWYAYEGKLYLTEYKNMALYD